MKIKAVNIARLIAVIVTITSIYLFAPWEFGLYYLKATPDTVQEELDMATSNGIDGLIVYVHQQGRESEKYAAGLNSRAGSVPARADALFKIASIAKLYDAAAVTKLVGEGKLSLENTLADYMPELVGRIQYADKINLKMMINHTSGIPNFTDDEAFHWGEMDLDVLELVLDDPADFEPGTDYNYSNTNYLLLQRIMNRVLGYYYADYIRQVILQPLGLERTYFSIHEVNPDDMMSGYYYGYDDDMKGLDQGYVATAEDVGIFLRALNEEVFFTEEEAATYRSMYEYNHDGWVLGYTSIARYHEDIDTVIIMFMNTTGNDIELLRNIVYGRVVDIVKNRNKS